MLKICFPSLFLLKYHKSLPFLIQFHKTTSKKTLNHQKQDREKRLLQIVNLGRDKQDHIKSFNVPNTQSQVHLRPPFFIKFKILIKESKN